MSIVVSRWSFLFLLVLGISADSHAAILIDRINHLAETPILNTSGGNVTATYEGVPGGNIGWYYTPTVDYILTRLETRFDAWNVNAFSVQTLPITITVYSERPALNGVILTSNTFDAVTRTVSANSTPVQGTDLSPTLLTAGTKYFIGFNGIDPANPSGENNYAIGVNFGTWQENNGVRSLSQGATIDLGAHYFGVDYQTENIDGFVLGGPLSNIRHARNSPILYFTGEVVPEPSTWTLIGIASVGCFTLYLRFMRSTGS